MKNSLALCAVLCTGIPNDEVRVDFETSYERYKRLEGCLGNFQEIVQC